MFTFNARAFIFRVCTEGIDGSSTGVYEFNSKLMYGLSLRL